MSNSVVSFCGQSVNGRITNNDHQYIINISPFDHNLPTRFEVELDKQVKNKMICGMKGDAAKDKERDTEEENDEETFESGQGGGNVNENPEERKEDN